jgi:hypothetical protein
VTYAQIKGGHKLHIVYEAGEGKDGNIVRAGFVSAPLCGAAVPSGYRMTINVPLANACLNCVRIERARRVKP